MKPIKLSLPIKTNANERGSSRNAGKKIAARRQGVKMVVRNAWGRQVIEAPGLQVTLTRVAPRALDGHDNLPHSMKPIVDGIADALGINDRDPRVSWLYAQRRGEVREYAVELRIEPRSSVCPHCGFEPNIGECSRAPTAPKPCICEELGKGFGPDLRLPGHHYSACPRFGVTQ